MATISRYPDGSLKCVTSMYSQSNVWHYVTREHIYLNRECDTLCGRLIAGRVGPQMEDTKICRSCASRRRKLEKIETERETV